MSNQEETSLAKEVERLRDDPKIRNLVEERVREFLGVNAMDTYTWFEELTYCLLTAYSSAERGQLCVDALCDYGVLFKGSLNEVKETLRNQGHRFAERRAEYIVEARRLMPTLKGTIQGFKTSHEAREWLVKNVKGLGWKESSHFLRNVGIFEVAIIDRHILANMREYHLINDDEKKGLTKMRYLDYESILNKVSQKIGIPLGEMDLYLWYRKTGKILK